MQRISNGPVREDWEQKVVEQGLIYLDTEVPRTDHEKGARAEDAAITMGDIVKYWREDKYFVLRNSETELLGHAGATLYQALIKAGDHVLEYEVREHNKPGHKGTRACYFHRLAIPEMAIWPIIRSWQLDKIDGQGKRHSNDTPEYWPTIYGRFDFCPIRDENGVIVGIKVYEFNADTPTSLFETVEIAWRWHEELFEYLNRRHSVGGVDVDQWNYLFDKLVDRWEYELLQYEERTGKTPPLIHLAYSEEDTSGEDYMTTMVMAAALEQACKNRVERGLALIRVKVIKTEAIVRIPEAGEPHRFMQGAPSEGIVAGYFTDGDTEHGPHGERIKMIFKLFPWEYFLDGDVTSEGFGYTAMHDLGRADPTIWIEPPYKMLWSNKGIWAVMWELFKDDPEIGPLLLETYFEDDPNIPAGFRENCASKPKLGREGASMRLIEKGKVIAAEDGVYGEEGYVLQALCPPPTFHDEVTDETLYAIIGLWMVGNESVGMCIRESTSPITNNLSFFAPLVVQMGV